MKANELMLGDWVRVRLPWRCPVDGHVEIRTYTHRVAGVRTYGPDADTIFVGAANIRPQDVEPIPITEEILEKNGWSPVTHSFEELDCYVKRMGESDWFRFECGEYGWPVHNVHELQHALLLFGSTEDFII